VDPPKPLKKRRDEPLDVTPWIRSGVDPNHMEITTTDPAARSFILGMVVCGPRRKPFEVASEIKEYPMTDCLLRIRSLLTRNPDEDIQTAAPSVKLTCPVSHVLMKRPARGRMCAHVQGRT
jgi:hypothetical protein